MQTMLAKDFDPNRPKYLVVFDDVSEKNTNTVSSVLKKGKADEPERAGIAILEAGETGVHTKIYENLGIAACDLSKSQHDALNKRSDVLAIVENEVRFLPPVRRSLEENDGGNGGEASHNGERSPRIAYLEGLRDAANLAIAFETGGMPFATSAAAPVMDVAALSKMTWALKMLGLATAMDLPTGMGIKVAVLDTGIDLNHPDLAGKVVEGDTAVSHVNGVTVQDRHGHGTHCAGVVCGPHRSISGRRYGVAPDAELLVGKVFNNNLRPTASDDDILDGIAWADQKGARVMSMSLGSVRLVNGNFPIQYEVMVKKLLNRPTNSILVIAAAGNESRRPMSTSPVGNPASCPSIMAVAAIDRFKRIADFSCCKMDNVGEVDVSAPGVAIFSSFLNGTFATLDGTSMATPHVAGLAALYLERTPNMTAKNLFKELKKRARMLNGSANDFGTGLVQL